ncbi:MAG: tRNA pseudouridine(38-40) synthase TruA [Candidatus Sumerlaeota bacterium]|nr:tRNA pseudouridine(38-40) synthase TruA [Candidatus Sumerlaeota bacterium]
MHHIKQQPDSARNIRMILEYDGSRYVGWQRQKNGVSVQQRIEEALEQQLGHKITAYAAGRTDAGVHALGQVINFRTTSALKPRSIMMGTIARLPRCIAIVAADEVPHAFDARRNARMRWYRYFILNRGIAPAVASCYLTHVPYTLDFERMIRAANLLSGTHDFRAFRANTCTAKRTLLELQPIDISQLRDHVIVMDFRCQSFLQNMVRILAGCLVSCGRGKMAIELLHEMLESGIRHNDAITLPPNGLFLYKVIYDDSDS